MSLTGIILFLRLCILFLTLIICIGNTTTLLHDHGYSTKPPSADKDENYNHNYQHHHPHHHHPYRYHTLFSHNSEPLTSYLAPTVLIIYTLSTLLNSQTHLVSIRKRLVWLTLFSGVWFFSTVYWVLMNWLNLYYQNDENDVNGGVNGISAGGGGYSSLVKACVPVPVSVFMAMEAVLTFRKERSLERRKHDREEEEQDEDVGGGPQEMQETRGYDIMEGQQFEMALAMPLEHYDYQQHQHYQQQQQYYYLSQGGVTTPASPAQAYIPATSSTSSHHPSLPIYVAQTELPDPSELPPYSRK